MIYHYFKFKKDVSGSLLSDVYFLENNMSEYNKNDKLTDFFKLFLIFLNNEHVKDWKNNKQNQKQIIE